MLVADFVENWWRRERIRRAQATELKSRLAAFTINNLYDPDDLAARLSARLFVLTGDYQAAAIPEETRDRQQIRVEIEELRRQLMSTSNGIKFLVKTLESIKE